MPPEAAPQGIPYFYYKNVSFFGKQCRRRQRRKELPTFIIKRWRFWWKNAAGGSAARKLRTFRKNGGHLLWKIAAGGSAARKFRTFRSKIGSRIHWLDSGAPYFSKKGRKSAHEFTDWTQEHNISLKKAKSRLTNSLIGLRSTILH